MSGTSPTIRATEPPPAPPCQAMAWIPAGTFQMGSDHHYPEEAPAHRDSVTGFWIDTHPVTNTEFHRFIHETGYVTTAEVAPAATDYPDADPALLVPGSAVFHQPHRPVHLRDHREWWAWTPGADWRHPEGPDSTLAGRDNHPVVHVAHADATAYATWAGKALPTEAEWEYAARGGLDGAEFAWGAEFTPHGRHMANTWQGDFPVTNLMTDGWERTAPVGSFPPNNYGLFDMIGNVWEWTSDQRPDHPIPSNSCCTAKPEPNTDPLVSQTIIKGGSFLCAPSYCRRYRPAARMHHPTDTSTCHIGFRCIVRSTHANT